MEAKVKALVAEFKLEEALDELISQAQTQTQRKQNTLLVMKGKLAMLEEQRFAGILDADEVARQKAALAHQILDIADGSPLDFEMPQPVGEAKVMVQKTMVVPAAKKSAAYSYFLWGAVLLLAVLSVIFIAKSSDGEKTPAEQSSPTVPTEGGTGGEAIAENTTEISPNTASDRPLKVLDFPNYRRKFNFLDFQYEFQDVVAEAYSDTEIKLTIRYHLSCKSNLGVCYRAVPRIYAGGNPIGPTHQKELAGWFEHNATAKDELIFVLPADANSFQFELSRDGSTWRRPFKILIGQ